jgi:hypothetical protein
MKIPDGYRRVSEAAALTATPRDTIYQWARKGRVAAHDADVHLEGECEGRG